MASFDPAYDATNAREKMVLSDVATDRGKMTYGGIARGRKPGEYWSGWDHIDAITARGPRKFSPTPAELAVINDMHRDFFREYFWNDLNASLIPDQVIANKVYDVAVNCSRVRAATWLQKGLNVSNRRGKLWPDIKEDGAVGPATCGAIAAACRIPDRKWLVLQTIETQQEDHYFRLAETDPSQEENLLGWYRHRILFRTEAVA